MKFSNRLKGSITQVLVRSLLLDSGITVVPLGIEEVIREVTELQQEQYLALDLPEPLRKLPDFFAVDRDRKQSWLIEVKFRKSWTDETKNELLAKLTPQVVIWNPIYLVLFFGETPSTLYKDQPGSWVRVAKLIMHDGVLHIDLGGSLKPWADIVWNDMHPIHKIFPQLKPKKWEKSAIKASIEISKSLDAIT